MYFSVFLTDTLALFVLFTIVLVLLLSAFIVKNTNENMLIITLLMLFSIFSCGSWIAFGKLLENDLAVVADKFGMDSPRELEALWESQGVQVKSYRQLRLWLSVNEP